MGRRGWTTRTTTSTTASDLSWPIFGRCSATVSSSTRESLRSTGTRRSWRRSWTSCCRCGFLSLLSTLSQMLSTLVQSQTKGLAHLKLDQVKRRKGARGKENTKRKRNTWIVTTRAIPTVMLQELSIYKVATDWDGHGFLG